MGGRQRAGNLFLLDETRCHEPVPGVRILGVGGNFIPEGEDFFAPTWVRSHGQILASWVQFARLLAAESERPPCGWRILATHVSPGKARLLARYVLALGASMSVSGHMGPPFPQTYSLFAVCEPHEVLERSRAEFEHLREHWAACRKRPDLSPADRALVDASIARLDLPSPAPSGRGGRAAPGSLEERFRRTTFLNLPDGAHNWSVLGV